MCKRNQKHNNGNSPDTVLESREQFKVEVFLIILQLNERLGTYQVVSDMFGLLVNLQDMALDEVVAAADVLSPDSPRDFGAI